MILPKLKHEDVIYLREQLLLFINKKCVFRCDPDFQYAPGIPKGTIPGNRPGSYNTWQLYLRNLVHDGDMMAAASMLLIEKFEENNEPNHGLQLAGLATGSLPFISFFQCFARKYNRYYNSFSVRKERKGYGLFNLIDGIHSRHPVVVMDDIMNSGSALTKTLEASLYEFDLDPHHNAYCLINMQPQTSHRVYNGTHIKINSLFTSKDIDKEFSPEKYWVPEDCMKHTNYRPDYR